MNMLTSFLKKNPELLTKYVSVGFSLVDKAISPLNKIMVHLLEVQEIDPKTQPGTIFRNALNKAINVIDEEEYDEEFEFSRFHTRFQKVSNKLAGLNLTADTYRKITDLSLLSDETITVKDIERIITKPSQNSETYFEQARTPTVVGPSKKTKTKAKAKETSTVTKSFKHGVFRRVK